MSVRRDPEVLPLRLPARFRGFAGGLAALAVSPALAIGQGSAAIGGLPDNAGAAIVISGTSAPVATAIAAATATPMAATPLPTPATPRPTARPTAPPPPPQSPRPTAIIQITPKVPVGTIQGIIAAAAAKFGVSLSWMLKIAACESGFNPRAVNPIGPFIGLFQFWGPTFRAHGGTNIWDPVQQANIAADMLAHGQASAWACA